MGCIAFSPLAQGVLTAKYLDGVPEDSRINRPGGDSLLPAHLRDENIERVRAMNEMAKARGQSLAQMALAWALRDPRVTSALIGASRPEQVSENVPRWTTWSSRPRSWPRSRTTRRKVASTCGHGPPATSDP